MEKTTIVLNPNFYFKLANGIIIKNISELPFALEKIDDVVFRTHVNEYKNDFAAWIYDIYGLQDLAQMLGTVKSRDENIRLLKAYLRKNSYINSDSDKITYQNTQDTKYISMDMQNGNSSKAGQEKPADTKKDTAPGSDAKQKPPASALYKWNTSVNTQENSQQQHVQFVKTEQKNQKKENEKQVSDKKTDTKEQPQPKQELQKKDTVTHNLSQADDYFEKNPVLVSQFIDAKKKSLSLPAIEPMDYQEEESSDQIIEKFKDVYSKAYQSMSSLRKNGFDTALAEVMLLRIPSKIKVYEASREKKDAVAVKRYLNEAIEELNTMLS
jgi:hypothetical protein